MLNIVLFGPPGIGKGTQSELLIKKFNLTHLSTGDILREERKQETELGLIAKDYHEKGNLVPSELVNQIMDKVIQEKMNPDGFIFDGYPRRVDQAISLDKTLNSHEKFVSIVISLQAGQEGNDDSILRERLIERGKTSGRPDDQDINIINTRIEVYKQETMPVLQYYSVFGKVYAVDGTESIETVFANICEHIEALYKTAADE